MSKEGKRDRSADRWSDFLRWLYLSHFPRYWRFVKAVGPLRRLHNWRLITRAAQRAPSRPHALSSMPPKGDSRVKKIAGYTSWESLTDREWFGRHRPPRTMPIRPDDKELRPLFMRKEAVDSEDSSVLFLSFAQWLTDGFLMTDLADRRRTFSSHQIDLNQLYGLTREQTHAVRTMSDDPELKGRLKFETIGGEDYAPKLYDRSGIRKAEFAALREPLLLEQFLADVKQKDPQRASRLRGDIFAFAGERANTTPFTAMLNTLFLREHNRLAAMLAKDPKNHDWDDEQIFQTARNINIAQLIKIVIEEYINHISPYYFELSANPRIAWRASWNKPNWIPFEFNLLYRWHSLVPDQFHIDNPPVDADRVTYDNSYLLGSGLASLAVSASKQLACKIGLFNTANFLVDLELRAMTQGRDHQVGSYNDYREHFGFRRVTRLEQITGDTQRLNKLRELYGDDPENVEFYVGLLAEDILKGAALPPLMGRMVGLDAFTQALTNPLLSEQVYNARTFTEEGLKQIDATRRLEDVLNRNLCGQKPVSISMTYKKPKDAISPPRPIAPADGVRPLPAPEAA